MRLDELDWQPYGHKTYPNVIWTKKANLPGRKMIYWSELHRVYTIFLAEPNKYIRYMEPIMAQCVLHLLDTCPSQVLPDVDIKHLPTEVT